MERESGKITYLTLITPVPPTGRVKKKKKKKDRGGGGGGGGKERDLFLSQWSHLSVQSPVPSKMCCVHAVRGGMGCMH